MGRRGLFPLRNHSLGISSSWITWVSPQKCRVLTPFASRGDGLFNMQEAKPAAKCLGRILLISANALEIQICFPEALCTQKKKKGQVPFFLLFGKEKGKTGAFLTLVGK